jgi:hypothetical protein
LAEAPLGESRNGRAINSFVDRRSGGIAELVVQADAHDVVAETLCVVIAPVNGVVIGLPGPASGVALGNGLTVSNDPKST